jgi:hypothetical protein
MLLTEGTDVYFLQCTVGSTHDIVGYKSFQGPGLLQAHAEKGYTVGTLQTKKTGNDENRVLQLVVGRGLLINQLRM